MKVLRLKEKIQLEVSSVRKRAGEASLSLLAFLLLMSMMACGGETAEQRTKRVREEERRADSAALKIGVMPTEDCLPIVVAKNLRLFDTLGVDVRLRKYHALSECRHALTGKKVEGAAIDSTLMAVLRDKGMHLYNGRNTNLSWKFLTAKKARITRVDQLDDKMIGADSHGESHRLAEEVIAPLLQKKMHVFIIQVEDLRVRMDMLINGNVDAALLPEPFASRAIRHGAQWMESVKSTPKGVVAFRTEAMKTRARRHQQEMFVKALDIAEDSIREYGKAQYMKLLNW